MQGSKTIERGSRTRSKNPERVEKALAVKAARKGADRRMSQERNEQHNGSPNAISANRFDHRV